MQNELCLLLLYFPKQIFPTFQLSLLQTGKRVEDKDNFKMVYKEKENEFSCQKPRLLLHQTRLNS